MEPQTSTRREMETALIEKCWKDPEFKKAVVNDPKGMLERQTGQKLPPQVKIFIHEEDANTLHLSIPPAPGNLAELSDEDLEKVAGGTDLVATISLGFLAFTVVASVGAGVGGAVGQSKGW
jgi:hypothetical protein